MSDLDGYITKRDAIEAIRRERDIKAIADLPSADVVERKRGYWVHDTWGGYLMPQCRCSNCDLYVQQETNFCPDCGANMREREER